MFKLFAFFVFLCFISADFSYGTDMNKDLVSARQVLEEFCQGELSGIRNLRREAIFNPEYERKVANLEFKGRIVNALYVRSLFVVDSIFHINEINLDSDTTATTIVMYKRLARFVIQPKTADGKIFKDLRPDSVKYQLVKKDCCWLISDPPILRISKKALVDIYKDQLYSFSDRWFIHATRDQLDSYHNKRKILE